MRVLRAAAIILDVVDLQERDRIVTFLTAEHGKKRGVARSARTKFSRFAGQLQPLAKVDIGWFEREGRDLVRISEAQLLRPTGPWQRQLEGILLGSYLAEHLVEFTQEDEESSRLFRLLDSSLEALSAGIDQGLVGRYFEVWVLRLAGIFPIPYDCPLCGQLFVQQAILLAQEEALVCPDCARHEGGGLVVAAGELEFLQRSGRENLQRMAQDPPSPAVLARVEEICARIRRNFLQKELRSYRVMRETLGRL